MDDVSASDLGTNQTISSRYSETDALGVLETVVSEINYLLSFLREQSKPGANGEDGGPLNGDHFIQFYPFLILHVQYKLTGSGQVEE